MSNHQELAQHIWQIADLLRGPYRPPQYERVMLPMTVLRRFDCVLDVTKEDVLKRHKQVEGKYEGEALDTVLNKVANQKFHNHSPLDFRRMRGAPNSIAEDLASYIHGFSENVQKIFSFFDFEKEIELMNETNILYLVVSEFAKIDLHPDVVSNIDMGILFENLIRRFNELANETAGDHFTPREVIKLMIDILFINDDKLLSIPGTVRKMLDPTCGTGGMLAEAQAYLKNHHSEARLYAYGQDYNKRAYATAASDMLIKEVAHNGTGENIRYGDSLIDDKFFGETFDYLIANPPFGVDWKKQQSQIVREHNSGSPTNRFEAGLPRVNDGALLFLQHMISKFEDVDENNKKYGSRLAVVFSGSPLFSGGAGSGESDIRKWIIDKDWLEAVIALPEQMFYNTGIGTYIWIVTNRKEERRKGIIQLVDAREYYIPMRKNMGNKRRKIGDRDEDELDQIGEIVRIYGRFGDSNDKAVSKVFHNAEFGYTRVTLERPLRLRYQMTFEDKTRFLEACPRLLDDIQNIDKELGREPLLNWNRVDKQLKTILKQSKLLWKSDEKKFFRKVFTKTDPKAEKVKNIKGGYEADPDLRDYENIPLERNIEDYFQTEVVPFIPDAWMDRTKDKVGYEINFNRYFYENTKTRSLAEIDKDLQEVEAEILKLLSEVVE